MALHNTSTHSSSVIFVFYVRYVQMVHLFRFFSSYLTSTSLGDHIRYMFVRFTENGRRSI